MAKTLFPQVRGLKTKYVKRSKAERLEQEARDFAILRQAEADAVLCAEVHSGEACADCRRAIQLSLDAVIIPYLPWVQDLANRHLRSGMDFEDLVSAGYTGLIRAALSPKTPRERAIFKPSRGHLFCTYATFWVRQAMMIEVYEVQPLISVPRGIQSDLAIGWRGLDGDKTGFKDRLPDIETLAHRRRLGNTEKATVNRVDALRRALQVMGGVESLSRKVGCNSEDKASMENPTLGELLTYPPERCVDPVEEACRREGEQDLMAVLRRLLASLPSRWAILLEQRWGLDRGCRGRTIREIAEAMGVTTARIRQLEARALARLYEKIEQLKATEGL